MKKVLLTLCKLIVHRWGLKWNELAQQRARGGQVSTLSINEIILQLSVLLNILNKKRRPSGLHKRALADWVIELPRAVCMVHEETVEPRSEERLWRWATWNENLLSNKECREHSSLDVIKKCVIKFNYSLNKVNTTLCGDSSYHTENSSSCGRIWWQQREGIELLRSSAHAINQDMTMK